MIIKQLKTLLLGLCLLLPIHLTLAEQPQPEYEVLDNANLVYLNTTAGLVVIEVNHRFAPKHAQRFKDLVKSGFYDGLDFYRVIDGFVAQGGDVSGEKESAFRSTLPAEYTLPVDSKAVVFEVVQSPEFLAAQTGFAHGFPAGRSFNDKQQWLLHCPGAVAMARGVKADSATTDFYIVIGQAPRHLDRNMSIFGQVVYGMANVQSIKRGDAAVNGGVIDNETERTRIISASIGSDLPADEQMSLERLHFASLAFQSRLRSARTLDNEFFHYKGTGNLDVCYYRPTVRVRASED
ncbi:peptidylprolyl isomerase [Alteromonas sp. ASW11-36]|uniref:peptidylprolyl isomerase n=1 Tax=Alteromonas arenosi TaxID=3055817 RepID=A0ABT7SXX5_9ALTE|nr:peptidylprolyl isomerase [Alteromonas sp. ASW11-36]MDM7861033.1 peptidylprolyl isomerase [Alteromonas sp. ASW11-36]